MLAARLARAPRLGAPALVALAILGAAALLIVLPPLYGAAAVVGTAVAVLILRYPRLGLSLLLLSIPVQDTGAVGQLTLTNVLFGLTLASWLVWHMARREGRLPRAAVGPLFTIFVAGLALSLVVAQDLGPGVQALFQWVKALLVYFIALDLLRARRHVLWALVSLVVAGTGEALLGLYQYVTASGPASFDIGEDFSRAYGTFGKPNSYAGYLEMLFPLGLALTYWLWREWRGRRPDGAGAARGSPLPALAAGGATLLIGGAIVASLSRGAWLGTLGGLVAMILLAGRRSRGAFALALVPLALFILVGGLTLLPTTVSSRFASIFGGADTADVRTAYVTAENFAILERKSHWIAGLNMFQSNYLLGVGLGNFNARYAEFEVSPTFLVSQGHAHNYYIQAAAEAGLVGLTTYLALLGALFLTGFHALRAIGSRDPIARGLVIAALGVVTAMAIHNFFEVLYVLSMGIQVSVIWALLTIAPARLARAEVRS
ncbi:MAG TPA: O-antigen ligase family protein [Thermomicrobiales bacterium]|nr:O-antigen ligase family protein [Thermomicrobiales bacterium]